MGAVPRIPAGYPTARIPSLLKRVKDGVVAGVAWAIKAMSGG